MRKVLRNHKEVAHYWANRSQLRGESGNMFFEGDTIYSYGRHFIIAKLVRDRHGETVALFNNDSYSTSTSKHQSYTRNAASHLKQFRVPDLDSSNTSHKSNVMFLLQEINDGKYRFKRDRSGSRWAVETVITNVGELVDYIDIFGIELKAFDEDVQKDLLFLSYHKKKPFTELELIDTAKYKERSRRHEEKREEVVKKRQEALDEQA